MKNSTKNLLRTLMILFLMWILHAVTASDMNPIAWDAEMRYQFCAMALALLVVKDVLYVSEI